MKGVETLSLFSFGFSISNACLHELSSHYLPAVDLFMEACCSLWCSGEWVQKRSVIQDLEFDVWNIKVHISVSLVSQNRGFSKVREAEIKAAYCLSEATSLSYMC